MAFVIDGETKHLIKCVAVNKGINTCIGYEDLCDSQSRIFKTGNLVHRLRLFSLSMLSQDLLV